jgi:hypothetical protein
MVLEIHCVNNWAPPSVSNHAGLKHSVEYLFCIGVVMVFVE